MRKRMFGRIGLMGAGGIKRLVHDGEILCPVRLAKMDVTSCLDCAFGGDFVTDDSGAVTALACRPPLARLGSEEALALAE